MTGATPPPGLDPNALAGLRGPRRGTSDLPGRIAEHLAAHDGYLAYSGGKDSSVVLHLALQADPNIPVVFFDSGFEFPETYTHIAQVCARHDVSLTHVPARQSTLEVLISSGGWDHRAPLPTETTDLHDVLIGEPSRRAHTEFGPGEVWGVRAQESRGRGALYGRALRTEIAAHCHGCCTDPAAQRARHGGVVRRADATVAYGPIWDWSTRDVWAYLHTHDLPPNPVYAKLAALGAPEGMLRVSHLLDGSRLEQGRVTFLRRGWPALFHELCEYLPRLREFV